MTDRTLETPTTQLLHILLMLRMETWQIHYFRRCSQIHQVFWCQLITQAFKIRMYKLSVCLSVCNWSICRIWSVATSIHLLAILQLSPSLIAIPFKFWDWRCTRTKSLTISNNSLLLRSSCLLILYNHWPGSYSATRSDQ